MTPKFSASDLGLEMLDPGSVGLIRLFQHPGGDWEEPDPKYRNLRVDPPVDRKSDYAVLYTAVSIAAVAIECRILACDAADRYTYDSDRSQKYSVVRYTTSAPAIFIPLDGDNRVTLGLAGFSTGYAKHQAVAHELFTRFGSVVHGLSWESFHRNQPGRVYALWHHHKKTMGLTITSSKPYLPLAEDPDWKDLLRREPSIEQLSS